MVRIKAMLVLAFFAAVFLTVGCSNGADSSSESSGQAQRAAVGSSAGDGILVAYFSWADNTSMNLTDDMAIDALTTASIVPPGNTGLIAYAIQDAIGGDLFLIQAADPYSGDYNTCVERVADELDDNERPPLKALVDSIDDYDTVFIGYPIWNNTCPRAVLTFIESHDLSGKTIALFSAYGGGRIQVSVDEIKMALPDDCTVLEPAFGAGREGFAEAQQNAEAWAQALGIG